MKVTIKRNNSDYTKKFLKHIKRNLFNVSNIIIDVESIDNMKIYLVDNVYKKVHIYKNMNQLYITDLIRATPNNDNVKFINTINFEIDKYLNYEFKSYNFNDIIRGV